MSFTYDWDATGDDLVITRLRSEVGDTAENEGVRPDGTNFADAELLDYYADEGSHLGRTAARLCEVLARAWARVPMTRIESGIQIDPKEIARSFRASAKELRDLHGYGDDPQVVIVQSGRATATS